METPICSSFLSLVYDDISGQNISLMIAQAEEKHTLDNNSIDDRYGISNSFQSFGMGVDTCVDLDISQTVI